MKKHDMTPAKLRLVLSLLLILLAGAVVGVFMFGYSQLKTHAIAAQEVAAKAQVSQSSLNTLIATKQLLAENQQAVSRADQLVAQSKSYVYQNQIIADLNRYAGEAGLGISNITFTEAKTAKVAAAASSGSSQQGTASTGKQQASSASAAPAGVKSMTASVTLDTPLNYDAVLTFLHLIEQSLFKMQISQVSLSRSTDENNAPGRVSSDVLTIEVYVR